MYARSIILVLFLLFACAHAPPNDSLNRDLLVDELVDLTGFRHQVEYAFEAGRQSRRQTAEEMIRQIRLESAETDALYGDIFEREFLRMEEQITQSLSPEDALQKLIELYYAEFSTRELEGLVQHWKSPLGQKDRELGGRAMQEWTDWLVSRSQEVNLKSLQEFQRRLSFSVEEMSTGRPAH